MRLLHLTTLTMVAFAANPMLNRLAVSQYAMDPAAFAVIRVASGGVVLWYAVVPALGALRAGVAQLAVPLIAAIGRLASLGEALGWRFGVAIVLVMGGIGLPLWRR